MGPVEVITSVERRRHWSAAQKYLRDISGPVRIIRTLAICQDARVYFRQISLEIATKGSMCYYLKMSDLQSK